MTLRQDIAAFLQGTPGLVGGATEANVDPTFAGRWNGRYDLFNSL